MVQRARRRSFLIAGMAATAGVAMFGATRTRGQAWPARPVRFVVSFPPGGLTDLYARAYAEHISQHIGQPVIVENRAGGGGIIGCDHVAKSAPDGYTILFTISSPLVQSQVLFKKLPYDPNRDFTFISAMGAGPLPFAVNREVPVRSVKEFITLAKTKSVNIGSFAQGSTPHMVAQQLNKLYGTKIEVVHYKGEGPMWQDVLAGRIESGIGSFAVMGPHLKAGTIRALAVTTHLRSPGLPDVPTFLEEGLDAPIFRVRGWIGMLGPAGLPTEVTERLSRLVLAGANTPRIRQLYEQFGIPDKPTSPNEFEKIYRDEGPIWISAARELGITLD